MAEPSWLPSVWPSGAPDIEAHYKAVAPRQWLQGLYSEDSEAVKDQQAIGHCLSWVRKMTWWVMNRFFPHLDSDAYLLGTWETMLRLPSSGSIADRQNRIVAKIRNRGTLFEERIKDIFAPIFGVDSGADLSIAAPGLDQVWRDCISLWKMRWAHDPGQTLRAVSGCQYPTTHNTCPLRSQRVWAVGNGGKIFYKSGGDWVEETSGTANDLWGVWAGNNSDDHAWAVGLTGTVRVWNGSTWGAGPAAGPSEDLNAVDATPQKRYDSGLGYYVPAEVWVVGATGRVAKYDGSWTSSQPLGTGYTWKAVHAYAVDDVWICGNAGEVLNWDGTSWNNWTPVADDLFGIRKTQEGSVVAVGSNGAIIEFDDPTWTDLSTGSENWRSLHGWSVNRLVACGNDGVFGHFALPHMTVIQSGCNGQILRGVWADRCGPAVITVGWNGHTAFSDAFYGDGFARGQNCLHVYHTAETSAPDYPVAKSMIRLCQWAQQLWSVGQEKTLKFDDPDTGWGNACWG